MHISIRQNLKRDVKAQAGLGLILLLFLGAILIPLLIQDPDAFSTHIFAPPSAQHWLGTNDLGQDIFSRLGYGLRTSMLISLSAGMLATSISVIVGMWSGFAGGWTDMVIMRIIDALLILPSIIIIILISAFIRPNMGSLIVIISLFHWAGGARIIRGQTLVLKHKTHISCAKTFGAGKWYTLTRHINPDLGNIITASFLHNARSAVFLEAGMAFIGISSLSSVSLGTMMHNAFKFYYLPVWLWWLLPPGIMLSLILLSFTFLDNLMQKVIDPRLKDD